MASRVAAVSWACLVVALHSCDAGAEDLPATPEVTTAAPATSRPSAAPARPRSAPWDAEAFSAAAAGQLATLGHLLEAGAAGAVDVRPLLAADFACGPLQPDDLSTVFTADGITVVRGTVPAGPRRAGAEGLVRSLEAWSRPGSSDLHTKFKVFGVDAGNDAVTTEQLVSLTGRDAAGRFELHTRWTCTWQDGAPDEPPLLRSIVASDYEVAEVRNAGAPLFQDCTAAVLAGNPSFGRHVRRGVDHWARQIESALGQTLQGYQGLAIGDVNGDGREDVYLCQGGGLPNRLFVQAADGTATDRSAVAGVDWMERTTSALLVDLDNDGDQDLVVATQDLLVLANDGRGVFSLRAALPGVLLAYSLSAADYDGDGDLDLYACRYNPVRQETSSLPIPIPYHDANNGASNHLLRNDGEWSFRDVTEEVGLGADNRRFSWAAAWEDYDDDGDVDLYVANDFGRNCLYRNDGGTFTNVAAEAGVEDISAGMSVSWGDYDVDGDMDLYVSNMWSSAGNRISFQRKFQVDASDEVRAQFQRHARGNSLFENLGDGTFADVSVEAGVTMGRWSWGSTFVDFNNDGRDDLIAANGFLTAEDTADL